MDFKHVADLVSASFEFVGVAVLVIGAVLAFGMYIKALARRSDVSVAYHDLRPSETIEPLKAVYRPQEMAKSDSLFDSYEAE